MANLGSAYDKSGQKEKAIEYRTSALEISRKFGNRAVEASTSSLGNMYSSSGQHEKAIEPKMTLAIGQAAGDQYGEINAPLYTRPRAARQGNRVLYEAHELSHEIGDRKGEGLALLSIGVTHEELKQYREALKFFTASEAVHDAVWATLRTDDDRIAFGDTEGYVLLPLSIQRNHARLGRTRRLSRPPSAPDRVP